MGGGHVSLGSTQGPMNGCCLSQCPPLPWQQVHCEAKMLLIYWLEWTQTEEMPCLGDRGT